MEGDGGKTEEGKVDIGTLNSSISKYSVSYELL